MKTDPHLSPGECRVLALLTQERTYKEIAQDLDVRIGTVLTFAKRSFRKMHVHDRYAAVSTHRRMLKRTHYCAHLRIRDELVTGWEFSHQRLSINRT